MVPIDASRCYMHIFQGHAAILGIDEADAKSVSYPTICE